MVRQQLRHCFEQWGLPKAIRVDNGDPWATRSDVPSALALWLVGFGVKVLLNRPYRSTDNGIVERGHGVLANWVEPECATDCHDLQKQLDWAMTMQRERYPACDGKSRLEAYPALVETERCYQQDLEPQLWDFERVVASLATEVWIRRVDKVGRISLFSSTYSVGRSYRGQDILIQLDPATHEWVMETEQGQFLKRYFCHDITPEQIYDFNLTKRANPTSCDTGIVPTNAIKGFDNIQRHVSPLRYFHRSW